MTMRYQRPEFFLFVVMFAIVLLQLLSFTLIGQDMRTSLYFEHMPNDQKVGLSFGYQFAESGAEFGGFYQNSFEKNIKQDVEETEDSFMGIYCQFNMVRLSNFALKMKVRAGMINEKMFTITPSAELTYNFGERFSVGMGVGMRNLRPTYIPRVSIIF